MLNFIIDHDENQTNGIGTEKDHDADRQREERTLTQSPDSFAWTKSAPSLKSPKAAKTPSFHKKRSDAEQDLPQKARHIHAKIHMPKKQDLPPSLPSFTQDVQNIQPHLPSFGIKKDREKDNAHSASARMHSVSEAVTTSSNALGNLQTGKPEMRVSNPLTTKDRQKAHRAQEEAYKNKHSASKGQSVQDPLHLQALHHMTHTTSELHTFPDTETPHSMPTLHEKQIVTVPETPSAPDVFPHASDVSEQGREGALESLTRRIVAFMRRKSSLTPVKNNNHEETTQKKKNFQEKYEDKPHEVEEEQSPHHNSQVAPRNEEVHSAVLWSDSPSFSSSTPALSISEESKTHAKTFHQEENVEALEQSAHVESSVAFLATDSVLENTDARTLTLEDDVAHAVSVENIAKDTQGSAHAEKHIGDQHHRPATSIAPRPPLLNAPSLSPSLSSEPHSESARQTQKVSKEKTHSTHPLAFSQKVLDVDISAEIHRALLQNETQEPIAGHTTSTLAMTTETLQKNPQLQEAKITLDALLQPLAPEQDIDDNVQHQEEREPHRRHSQHKKKHQAQYHQKDERQTAAILQRLEQSQRYEQKIPTLTHATNENTSPLPRPTIATEAMGKNDTQPEMPEKYGASDAQPPYHNTPTESNKIILISQNAQETRVALLYHGVLDDFDCETFGNPLKKGNIYWGRIAQIRPALHAVFVDYGVGRHGFLEFSHIHPTYYGVQEEVSATELALPMIADIAETSSPLEEAMHAATSTQENAAPHLAHGNDASAHNGQNHHNGPALSYNYHALQRNQMVLVQVAKDERGKKGAFLTTYISLPGRMSVFLPNTPKNSGISKRVTDATERERLRQYVEKLSLPHGQSMIVRTPALSQDFSALLQEYKQLQEIWRTMVTQTPDEPRLMYEESDLIFRTLRDHYREDVQAIWVHGHEAYKKTQDFARRWTSLCPMKGGHGATAPLLHGQYTDITGDKTYASASRTPSTMRDQVRKNLSDVGFSGSEHAATLRRDTLVPVYEYTCEHPSLFQAFHVEKFLAEIYNPVVTLPSGGFLVISPTEALVAVDVNSGKSTSDRNPLDTAMRTNKEACYAIAQQLRLRKLSGQIVIDFIDIPKEKYSILENAIQEALQRDRARIKIGKINEFCLLTLSRQSLRPSLMESHTHLCTHCHGSGRMPSVHLLIAQGSHMIEHALRQYQQERGLLPSPTILRVASAMAMAMLNQGRERIHYIERLFHTTLFIMADDALPLSSVRLQEECENPS